MSYRTSEAYATASLELGRAYGIYIPAKIVTELL